MNPDDINKFDYDKVMNQLVKINKGEDLYLLSYDSSNTLAKKFLNFENRITCVEIKINGVEERLKFIDKKLQEIYLLLECT